MKHRVAFRKLRRTSEHRWSMLRTMVSQLIEHERIETTVQKAKEVRRLADRCVTWGKEVGIALDYNYADLVCNSYFSSLIYSPHQIPFFFSFFRELWQRDGKLEQ